MEPAISSTSAGKARATSTPASEQPTREEAPFPISAFAAPSDMDVIGTPAGNRMETEDGSDAGEEEDGLFAGGDDEEEGSDGMEEVSTTEPTNGVKRKLVEEDDYD